ncbi:MAG: chromosome segregation protein SMC, partial [Gammaproteobacteria bacterium]|nr:chromosome segregation protein SMC [Gammaproteobacteria bacterium]
LNNVRCRRKDITGIFLGTGLGPRSYAIIEQGMISRLIEAKPEEMRVYIEEAAGISKYKERRRETENRIRHTRDNLDRLNDLREEVEKQLKHLQRQKRQAERYKELKQEERTLEGELLAIRLTDMERRQSEMQTRVSQSQTSLEAAIADQRNVEAGIETAREQHTEANDLFQTRQQRNYALQAEIAQLEQSIKHGRETRERQTQDLEQAQSQLSQIVSEIDQDKAQLEELESSLERLAPDLQQARAAELASAEKLKGIEDALDAWRKVWHDFTLETEDFQKVSEVEAARIEQLENRVVRLQERDTQLGAERDSISLHQLEEQLVDQTRNEDEVRRQVETAGQSLADIDQEVGQLREHEQQLGSKLQEARGSLDSRRGRLEALEALQAAAFGEDQEDVGAWMSREQLDDRPRLAQNLEVEKPWERAVETVLGDFLQAICVTRVDEYLSRPPSGDVVLLNSHGESVQSVADSLLAKVTNAGSAAHLLAGIHTADSLQAALSLRESLGANESVITTDGIWLGKGWVRIHRGQLESGGVISREQDIRSLRDEIVDYEQQVIRIEADRRNANDRLQKLESDRVEANRVYNEVSRKLAEVTTVLAGFKEELERNKERLSLLQKDGQQVRDELETLQSSIRISKDKLAHATDALSRIDDRRAVLESQQDELHKELGLAKEIAHQDRERVTEINVEFETRRASRESANTTLSRISSQRELLDARVNELLGFVNESQQPLTLLEKDLEQQLVLRVDVERAVADQRHKLEAAETSLREQETRRNECENAVTAAREVADQLRMDVREIEVRKEGVAEQFGQLSLDLASVVEALAEDAEITVWEENLDTARRRIERLGAINLAAIEEFDEQSERKIYLDAQYEDLTNALETLEGAIRKIDRETRTRFKETFDKVNQGIQRLFPKLFGGGHAYLSLEGDDLLNAGVTVMARPPGKRNSTIHLLSGGEKALTAVSLVFSIFELNPAPFCLLDEVDAPLDDANVGRFCDIVKEMSETVQFLCITHNKTTMEMASQLTGVTMNEPGVSRLVSVDIDEAVQLVAS